MVVVGGSVVGVLLVGREDHSWLDLWKGRGCEVYGMVRLRVSMVCDALVVVGRGWRGRVGMLGRVWVCVVVFTLIYLGCTVRLEMGDIYTSQHVVWEKR